LGGFADWFGRPLFSFGRTEVSLQSLASFVALLAVFVLAARLVGAFVSSRLLRRTHLDRGLQYALGRITYYLLVVTGTLVALQTSGIEIGSLTVVLGALGVGIGFGLQNVVGNFVSGLILLAERPISVGDWIEVSGSGGRVDRIGARSTTIITNDNITIVVPNNDLVTRSIVNWSHADPRVRIRIPVGMAYGSDLKAVGECLMGAARNHAGVLAAPPPEVILSSFGDSALEMELAVWTQEMVQHQRRLRSDLNFAIEAAFRDRGVSIPFPQRDVHVIGAPPAGSSVP
jgi:small-conductance mechanosensitive channel